MDLLVNWVEGGAPEGDPVYLPTVRPAPEAPAEPAGHGSEVRGRLTLSAPMTLRSIRPSGAVEVVAVLPDGTVKRLLWVREFRPEWNRSYVLGTPLRLSKGAALIVYGAPVLVDLTK
jgi:hypothetical protein